MPLSKVSETQNRPRKLIIQPSAASPFCTNPSQLQEVTLDADTTNFLYMGMRSPGAPCVGRSVKEIDEQLTHLKKENFDLKLRIYFLEERIGANFDTDKEDAIKNNIELRVELETMRKDLEEKQELLFQAAKAMEIEEEEKKREIEARDDQILKLEQEIFTVKNRLQDEVNAHLQNKELALCAQAFDLNVEVKSLDNFQTQIRELQLELQKEKERADNLEHLIYDNDMKLKATQFNEVSLQLELVTNQLSTKESDIKQYTLELIEMKRNFELLLQDKMKLEKSNTKIWNDYQVLLQKQGDLINTNVILKERLHPSGASGHESTTQQVATSNSNPESVFYKTTPEITTSKSLNSTSLPIPRKLQDTNMPGDAGELVLYGSSCETNSVTSFSSNEGEYTTEKYLKIKKDHFKACKMLKSMIKQKKECDQHIYKLNTLVGDKERIIGHLQKQIAERNLCDSSIQKKPIQEMVTEMKLTFDPADTKEQNTMDAEESNLVEKYKELVNELETKIEVLTATLNEKDLQLEQLKIEMQQKANQIIDLEYEILAVQEGVSVTLNSFNEKEDTGTEKTQKDIEKDQQIEKLENELRRRTCDLQGLVNKELWEKNRAIEKMQNILKGKDAEIYELENNMQGKELQLKVLKEKINELGVHVNLPPSLFVVQTTHQIETPDNTVAVQDQLKVCMEERKHFIKEIEELQRKIKNIPEHDENHHLKQLTTDCKILRDDLERTEKLRQESHEICLVLTTRLEELSTFLNSLLKQKCILGFLGTEQATKLQEVVSRSIDLSQTLSSSLLGNPDQSLLQLNNITNLLNATCNDSDIIGKLLVQDDDNNSVLSIIPTDVKLTYHSHLNISVGNFNEQEHVINFLRQQISDLKHEIELRDVELGKKLNEHGCSIDEEPQIKPFALSKVNTNSSLYNKQKDSDSESWSEPDRSVSLARIGLLDESLKAPSNTSNTRLGRTTTFSSESTEDEQALYGLVKTPSKRTTLAESRQTVISLHEQVCELEEKLKETENQLLVAQVAQCETDNLLKREQLKLAEMKKEVRDNLQEINNQLEESENCRKHAEQEAELAGTKLVSLTEQINEKNRLLEEAQVKRTTLEQKILELNSLVTTLEDFKTNATNLHLMNKEMQNTINEMEVEKEEAIQSAKATEEMLMKANKEIEMLQVDLKNMQSREQCIREEFENNFQAGLKNAEEQYINSVRNIEHNYESQINKYQETVLEMKQEYEKNYVSRIEVDKKLLELDEISKELASLKYFIKEYENKMHVMKQKESELKTKIQDMQREHHDKIYKLHGELDNATLQYSEALLEKTKLQSEVTSLEQKVNTCQMKENDVMVEVTGLHKQFTDVQNNLHLQIAHVEHQKSLLELKVNELETVNTELQAIDAELRNRIVKLQLNRSIGERILSTSLPTCPGAILDLYPNKTLPINIAFNSNHMFSDNSGYTSEDIIGDEAKRVALPGHKALTEVEHDRLHGNSSPDLGIESDHGRFSSMEGHANVSRPLLPTLELTQSMNSLLDPIQDITCTNDQCCMKTKRIADENVELRKRLLRTRRALEDTLHRLTLANKQKKEVEKSICKQIHQTSQVLRKAKANLDSGSESDVRKN